MSSRSRPPSWSKVWALGLLGAIATVGASTLPTTITHRRNSQVITSAQHRVAEAFVREFDGAIHEARNLGSRWDPSRAAELDVGAQFGSPPNDAPKSLFRSISIVALQQNSGRGTDAFALRITRSRSSYDTSGFLAGSYLDRSLATLGLDTLPTASTRPKFAKVRAEELQLPSLLGERDRFDDSTIQRRARSEVWYLAVPVSAKGWILFDLVDDGLTRMVNGQPRGVDLAVELRLGERLKSEFVGAVRTDASIGATVHRTSVLQAGGLTFSLSASIKGLSNSSLPTPSSILFLGTLINALVVTVLASRHRRHSISALTTERDEALLSARTDPLTSLPNRLAVTEQLEAICADPQRKPLAVLMGDLDRFKIVNDARGHDAGDHLLIEVGQRLQSIVPDQLVARLGGDEFVAVLQSVGPDQAVAIGQKFVDALRRPFTIGEDAVVVGISIGLVHVEAKQPLVRSQLLTDADIAMYAAKRSGGNRVATVDDNLRRIEGGQLDLELDIRAALGTGQFVTWYQPLVDAHQEVRALEALVRWEHPERGLLSPGMFLPAAKSAGLLGEISTAVLARACTDVARWNETRIAKGMPPVVVHVNCVEEQLMDTSYADVVSAYIQMSNMDPAHLLLEVSEETAVEKLPKGLPTLQMIRSMGVRFSLDDFGFGNSSLTMVRQLGGVAEIKLDKSIVDGLAPSQPTFSTGESANAAGTSSPDIAVIKSVVEFAAAQNVLVVAEGIEHREQFDQLVALGVDLFQGYYFHHPQPGSIVEQLLLGQPVSATTL